MHNNESLTILAIKICPYGIIFINDIIDHEGKLSENFILRKLSLKTNWISEFTKLKKSIPKNWLNELESEISTKTAVKTNKISTDFMKWKQKLRKTICINKDMLKFTFHHLIENKLKIFRWKLLHFILPCKQLLY